MIHMTVTLRPKSDAVRHGPGLRRNGPRIVGRVFGPLCPTGGTARGPLCRPAPPCPALLSGDSRRCPGCVLDDLGHPADRLTEQDAPPARKCQICRIPLFFKDSGFSYKIGWFR